MLTLEQRVEQLEILLGMPPFGTLHSSRITSFESASLDKVIELAEGIVLNVDGIGEYTQAIMFKDISEDTLFAQIYDIWSGVPNPTDHKLTIEAQAISGLNTHIKLVAIPASNKLAKVLLGVGTAATPDHHIEMYWNEDSGEGYTTVRGGNLYVDDDLIVDERMSIGTTPGSYRLAIKGADEDTLFLDTTDSGDNPALFFAQAGSSRWELYAAPGYFAFYDYTNAKWVFKLAGGALELKYGQLIGGFGAATIGGTLDWNHSSNARSGSGYTLLYGSTSSNSPTNDPVYWHPFSFEYSAKDGTGNMTQFAIPYHSSTANIGMFYRTRYSSSWSSWMKIIAENSSGFVYIRSRLGIGVSSPLYMLDLKTNAASYCASFFNDGNAANRYGICVLGGRDDGGGLTLYFTAKDGTGDDVGGLRNNSGTFQLFDSSDRRLKRDIVDAPIQALDILRRLRVRNYRMAKQKDEAPIHTGFIAQEVQEILPSMVAPMDNGMLATATSELIPILVKAIQELCVQVEELKHGH